MLIKIHQRSKWHHQIVSFVQPTVINPKDSIFAVINDIEKQQILTFKKQEPVFLSEKLWKRFIDFQNS